MDTNNSSMHGKIGEDTKMTGLRKIRDLSPEETCVSPAHNPPMHIVLDDGVYEYTCPACGKTITFVVNKPKY